MIRFGLIIPSSNTTMEQEFCKVLANGFSIHSGRLQLKEVTLKALAKMEQQIEEEALKLADANVGVIGYGCTSGSLFKGFGHDREIEARIEKSTGIPAVATSGAVIAALKSINAKNIAVATPYTEKINKLEKRFLMANGFQIIDLKGLGIKDNLKIGKLGSEKAFKLAMKLKYDKADAIFISCTNLATLGIIDKLEKISQKIVVSSNSAMIWAMLRKCGAHLKMVGFGKLLESI